MGASVFYIPGGPNVNADCVHDVFTVEGDLVSTTKAFRPGLFTDAAAPNGSVFESADDGHLKWRHRDGTLHVLCDTGGAS